ncbi:MAG: type I restriction enzyme HsdR N-terminal domain-containing protein [Bacteroidota bacterium]
MEHYNLNFPQYDFRIQTGNRIFDTVRKKYVALTPEEWVRQHVTRFLLLEKNVPESWMGVEKQFIYNKMKRRADVVVFDHKARPRLIVECKAPSVKITQETFEQIARYNVAIRVDYLMVTNGLQHYYCKMDYENWSYEFLHDLPEYSLW